jgi:hypothetical protein
MSTFPGLFQTDDFHNSRDSLSNQHSSTGKVTATVSYISREALEGQVYPRLFISRCVPLADGWNPIVEILR